MHDATTNPGQYVVVARRYRPQSFESLIGQEHVAKALTGAIESGRVGHAYLFTGARGVGKTSAARILAKALDCVNGPTATPCNECEVCRGVAGGDDVDVIEIDGASNRGIDEIRQLRQNVAVRPSRARFKIYIIDEVHMLTKEAFNALLKTLEEPPEHVKFIFATTEPNKIPITILSRCQRYDFAGIDAASIHNRLAEIAEAEGVEAESEALEIIAMRAAGSMRDSQSLLEQLLATGKKRIESKDVTSMLGLAPASRLSRLVAPLVERNAPAALAEFDAALADGAEPGQLIDQLLGYFRDAMTQAVGCSPSQMLYALPSQRDEVGEVARQLGVETLLAISQILDSVAARLRLSTQVRTLAEMALVRICQLENLDELATLVEQLKAGGVGAIAAAPASGGAKKNSVASLPRPHMLDRGPAPQPRALPGGGVESHSAHAIPATVGVADNYPLAEPGAKRGVAVRDAPGRALPGGNVESHSAPGDVAGAVTADYPPAEPGAEGMAATEAVDGDRIEQAWKLVLESLSGMIYENAAAAERVEIAKDGRLVLSFPATAAGKFARERCQRPQALAKLEGAASEIFGRPVSIVLALHDAPAGTEPSPATAPATSMKQQQAAILAQPFVQKAVELFAVDPERVKIVTPGPGE